MRACPTCGSDIVYSNAKCLCQAEKAKRSCKPCALNLAASSRDEAWKENHTHKLKAAWAAGKLGSEDHRQKLAEGQRNRIDDRSVGAFKAARTRRENGAQEAITLATHTPEANAKRSRSHRLLRDTKPELWQTEKAKAAWKVTGEKGKTYINKAIAAAHANGSRSAFERLFEDPLRSMGFLPTQRIGRWWVDYANHETKVVVECYGDWHHCHPKYDARIVRLYNGIHPELEMTPVAKRAKDVERVADIEARGYHVIVIWQHDQKRWLSWISDSLRLSKQKK